MKEITEKRTSGGCVKSASPAWEFKALTLSLGSLFLGSDLRVESSIQKEKYNYLQKTLLDRKYL